MYATVGTGTFGRVRVVQHKPSGQFFALKILKKSEVGAGGGGTRALCLLALCTDGTHARAHAGASLRASLSVWAVQIVRLKQVDHIKSEVKLLTQIHHPFIVNL